MESLGALDLRGVLDALHTLGFAESMDDLPLLVSQLAFRLVPCDRASWIVIDFADGTLAGVHWPEPESSPLPRLPRNLQDVPLVPQISERVNSETLRISDVWSRREWHAKRIYSELYRPNGGEYQMVMPLSFASPGSSGTAGRRVEALSLVRADSDFSDRDRAILNEFGRHVRGVMRMLRRATTTPSRRSVARFGLTARQGDALLALVDGSSIRYAATQLGVTPKTLENHLQAAYRRLGVSNRTAALSQLAVGGGSAYGLGEIPH
ncbi:MAG: LuxR C-terminal-related transcriptional regulator [Rhodoglobus sp.]